MPQIGAYEVQEDGVERRYGGPNLGWQTPESYEKAESEGMIERPWYWHLTPDGLSNHFEFMERQKDELNERVGYQGPATIGNIPLPLSIYGDRVVAGNSTPAIDQRVYGGTAGVALNLAELGSAAGQKLDKGLFTPVDPYSDPTMKVLGQLDEAARESASLEQKYDRPKEAAVFENQGAEITTTLAGSGAGALAVPATAFTKAPWFARLSPQMQKALRWASGTTIESVVSTTGTANQNLEGNLSNAVTPNGPFSVQPTDDILSATAKSYIPNAALELSLAGLFDVSGRGLSYGYQNVATRVAQGRAISQINNARLWAENNGLELRPDPNIPKWEFPDAKQPVDPAAPEVEVVVKALDQLDDEALKKLDAVEEPAATDTTNGTADAATDTTNGTEGTPAPETAADVDELLGVKSSGLDALEETLQEQAYVPRVESSEADALVPSDRLAEPTVPYAEQWEQLLTDRLLGLANPETSPALFKEVNQLTGKEYENFTRRDVLDGLKGLQAKGQTLVPNRLQGDVVRVADIQVDPQRFQFKEGTNESGEQLGNSLSGVERWNPDAEGEISVWEDPADGLTYVVNGHNRLAKAKQLGVPTMRVRQILASDAGQARALGAIENISQGGGTVFDAAKFIREAGIQSPEALEASGIPIQSGTGAQGLALSRLPDQLFQEAVNGELPVNRAAKLGGSGLDDETMIRVARMGDNMSERGFAELVDMAGTAPQVESDQMGLFGAEMMDTITIKAELAAKVKTLLTQNKNLMAKVSKKQAAEQLAGVGTNVNVSAAQIRADLVRGLVAQFDADKYMTGTPISQLLNKGTEDIANGAKATTIAKRVVQQLSEASEAAPPAPKPADSGTTNAIEEPVDAPLTAAERNNTKKRIVKKLIDNGEVRPSETPIPELPEPPKDLNNQQQLLADELRLADEYQQQQARNDFAARQAKRDAMGYDDMTLEEKKANGMLDGLDEPAATDTTNATPQPEFTLPPEVAKSAPRFGSVRLKFQSDLDKAAYIIRNKTKKSKGEPRIVKSLMDQGFNVSEIQRLGNDIKNQIQDAVEAQTGSRRAPQGLDIEIEVPASTRDGGGSGVDYSIDSERWAWMDVGSGFKYQKDLLKKDIEDAVTRVSGAKDVQLIGGQTVRDTSKAWGGKRGQKSVVNGWYDTINDIVAVSGFDYRPGAASLSTAYHEAFHRLQYRVLSEKDMNILDSAWGRAKISDIDTGRPKAYSESQAVAFQRYAEMRAKGITAQEDIMSSALDYLDEKYPLAGGRSWHESIRGKALDLLYKSFTAIWDTVDRLNNLARGRGYRTVYDMFDDAYDGELLKRRKNIEHETLIGELANKRSEEGLDISDDEIKSLVNYLERQDRVNDWRQVGAVLDKHKAHFQNEIDALKKKATTEGC